MKWASGTSVGMGIRSNFYRVNKQVTQHRRLGTRMEGQAFFFGRESCIYHGKGPQDRPSCFLVVDCLQAKGLLFGSAVLLTLLLPHILGQAEVNPWWWCQRDVGSPVLLLGPRHKRCRSMLLMQQLYRVSSRPKREHSLLFLLAPDEWFSGPMVQYIVSSRIPVPILSWRNVVYVENSPSLCPTISSVMVTSW